MNNDAPHILLVNPWIYDFAAYDVWAKPLGLLMLAAILRHHGFNVSYIDCLDRFHPNAPQTNPDARSGRGPYLKTEVPKPRGLENISRTYSRYGILEGWFCEDLSSIPEPDLVLVTSLMTYWYTGVHKTIETLKEFFPESPIVLGGIYATLCTEHAKQYSGADEIFTGPGSASVLELAAVYTGFKPDLKFNPAEFDTYPYPAFDLQHKINYVPVLTSTGCPYSCTYCASNFLNPERLIRSPDAVFKEIVFWHKKYGVHNFAFYDDALLVNAKNHIVPILQKIIDANLNLSFHTPNAVHIRNITDETARLMYKSGFKTLRLGLETTAFEERESLDRKVTEEDFIKAVASLKKAGFTKEQVGAYLLAGLPGQSTDAIIDSIKLVKESEITPIPAYYTPIPHTALWKKAAAASRYDIESDPILTNNAIMPCTGKDFSWETICKLKRYAAG
ncbi:MAG: B12-binding domain-containing radical SAM protein [Desulfobacterales bacterium]|nr:B12-binding domain-containing radical SAM protein [Desulfobacterales bacterium]